MSDPDTRASREVIRLRGELRSLTARYDDGAMPPGVYAVVQRIQRDIAWIEQQQAQEQQ